MTDMLNEPVPQYDVNPTGLAVASLILGIISIAFSLFLFGGILALIGFILGIIHLRKRTTSRTMAKWGIGLSVVGLLASIGLGYLYHQGYKQFQAAMSAGKDRNGSGLENWQGVRSPDFNVTSLEGRQIRMADLRGKRVVLDFWATWCPPCVREIPHFVRLVNDPDAKDLMIIGISNEEKDHLARFVKENGINYAIASGLDKHLPSPYKDVRSIPTTFFLDRNGVIQTVFQGYHEYEALKAAALADDFKGDIQEEIKAEDSAAQTSQTTGAEDMLENEP